MLQRKARREMGGATALREAVLWVDGRALSQSKLSFQFSISMVLKELSLSIRQSKKVLRRFNVDSFRS